MRVVTDDELRRPSFLGAFGPVFAVLAFVGLLWLVLVVGTFLVFEVLLKGSPTIS